MFIDDWRQAWRFFTVQAQAVWGLLLVVWLALPEQNQQAILTLFGVPPEKLLGLSSLVMVLVTVLARVVSQQPAAPPAAPAPDPLPLPEEQHQPPQAGRAWWPFLAALAVALTIAAALIPRNAGAAGKASPVYLVVFSNADPRERPYFDDVFDDLESCWSAARRQNRNDATLRLPSMRVFDPEYLCLQVRRESL